MLAKRHLMTLCVGTLALCGTQAVFAISEQECTEEVLMTYFPENYVGNTLETFKVPQAERVAIARELVEKDREVVPTIEDKAERMTPNPLTDPSQRQTAIRIFRETLYELFSDVMKAHGINDEQQIQAMLDDVQQQKARQFAACMDMMPSEPPPQNDMPMEDSGWNEEAPGAEDGYKTDYNQRY